MSSNSDYKTGNLLDYKYFSNSYKLIAIDSYRETELENSKSILLVTLEKDKPQCFSSLKNQKKQLLNFYEILWISYKMETQKIVNLLYDLSNKDSKFETTENCYVIDNETKGGYSYETQSNL